MRVAAPLKTVACVKRRPERKMVRARTWGVAGRGGAGGLVRGWCVAPPSTSGPPCFRLAHGERRMYRRDESALSVIQRSLVIQHHSMLAILSMLVLYA